MGRGEASGHGFLPNEVTLVWGPGQSGSSKIGFRGLSGGQQSESVRGEDGTRGVKSTTAAVTVSNSRATTLQRLTRSRESK